MEPEERRSCQEKVDHFFANSFNKWGMVVAIHPCKVFWFSIMFLIGCSFGMSQRKSFENQRLAWTPEGNPSIAAGDRSAEMFPSRTGFIGVIAEAKEGVDSILKLEAFKEMDRFDRMMKELVVNVSSN